MVTFDCAIVSTSFMYLYKLKLGVSCFPWAYFKRSDSAKEREKTIHRK